MTYQDFGVCCRPTLFWRAAVVIYGPELDVIRIRYKTSCNNIRRVFCCPRGPHDELTLQLICATWLYKENIWAYCYCNSQHFHVFEIAYILN